MNMCLAKAAPPCVATIINFSSGTCYFLKGVSATNDILDAHTLMPNTLMKTYIPCNQI